MAKVGARKRRERQVLLERIRQSQSRDLRVRAVRDPLLAVFALTVCLLALWAFA